MLLKLECRNISYDSIVFYWTIDPEVGERVPTFGYTLEMSESVKGPWQKLYNTPIYAFGYIDRNFQRGMVDQRVYFRVRAEDFTGKVFYSDSICLFENDKNYISNYIAEQEKLMLRVLNGTEYLHFARRKFGERCCYCYDIVERKSIKAKCQFCFGTTYKGGFFSPIRILINNDAKVKVAEKTDYGIAEQMSLTGWTSNEVIIEPEDLIIGVENPFPRYRVSSVLPTGIHGSITKQQLSLHQLTSDDPYQMIKINPDDYYLYEHSIFRQDWIK